MFTTHHHHIPGTVLEKAPVEVVGTWAIGCGGVKYCPVCIGQAYHATLVKDAKDELIRKTSYMDRTNDETKARVLVANYFNEMKENDVPEITLREIHIRSFHRVLMNWRAELVTDIPDGKLYILTYSNDLLTTHIHVYKKTDGLVVRD